MGISRRGYYWLNGDIILWCPEKGNHGLYFVCSSEEPFELSDEENFYGPLELPVWEE